MELREIADRLEIEALLTRYAKAVDRRDWDLYLTVFTDDATIDYSSAGGAGERAEGDDGVARGPPSASSPPHSIW